MRFRAENALGDDIGAGLKSSRFRPDWYLLADPTPREDMQI